MKHRLLVIGGWLAVLVGLLLLPMQAGAQAETAQVRVIHAAPDTPGVDVFVDGEVVLSNISFPTVSAYLALPAGDHTVAIAPTGEAVEQALLTQDVTVAAGSAYTVAAIGLADVSFAVFEDDLSPVAEGQARARFIHTSPDAPAVDIEVVDGPTLFQNVGFGEAGAYQDVQAGSYDLRAVASGDNTVVVQLPGTTLEAGTIYDVIAVGRLANIQVEVATFTPQAPTAVAGDTGTDDNAAPSSVMPETGLADAKYALLALGLVAIGAGCMLRRARLA
jgi:hypothetical protein